MSDEGNLFTLLVQPVCAGVGTAPPATLLRMVDLARLLASALAIKDEVKATESLAYFLELTSCRLRSLSQWVLYDPSLQAEPVAMREGEPLQIDLESVSELVAQSEINFRTLKEHVCSLLEERDQASIGDVLERFPAEQGLGSVVGLLALGSRHGIKGNSVETVAWVGEDDQGRRARIPKIFFLRDRLDELV
jgi:hypothetical protein